MAAVVVLPAPCRPARRIVVGGFCAYVSRRIRGAEQFRELVVDDLHDLLARRQALADVLPERALAHVRDEGLDDVEVDVGLEEREPHLAHRARKRLLVDDPAPAEVAEGALELVGQCVEHSPPGYRGGFLDLRSSHLADGLSSSLA